jgi:hypothetical protein
VAELAFDSFGTARAGRSSISLHPAFAAIVASWFAALLGLGSLLVPPGLLEQLLVSSGVAGLIPAARPPLGPAAIGGIALAGALAGGLAGIAIARRVTRGRSERAARPPRPISVLEDLGGELAGLGREPPPGALRAPEVAERIRSSDLVPDRPPGRDGGTAHSPEASNPATAREQPAQAELTRLLERLEASLERRRASLQPAPTARAATRGGLGHPAGGESSMRPRPRRDPAFPVPRALENASGRAETDAALRAALARLQTIGAGV